MARTREPRVPANVGWKLTEDAPAVRPYQKTEEDAPAVRLYPVAGSEVG